MRSWAAWEGKGEGRLGTLVERSPATSVAKKVYTSTSDFYSVGLMLLKSGPKELWEQDLLGQQFLDNLFGHKKTLKELLADEWLEPACKMLPGEIFMGLGSGPFPSAYDRGLR